MLQGSNPVSLEGLLHCIDIGGLGVQGSALGSRIFIHLSKEIVRTLLNKYSACDHRESTSLFQFSDFNSVDVARTSNTSLHT